MGRVAALVCVLAACGDASEPPDLEVLQPVRAGSGTPDRFTGVLAVDGKAARLEACRPGHTVHTFIEVVTSAGKLRFEDQRLYWNPNPAAITRGEQLDCKKLDRSWGGGNRTDGTSYWRGTLAFDCGALTGDLVLDCGSITAAERAQLDGNRKAMQDEQRK